MNVSSLLVTVPTVALTLMVLPVVAVAPTTRTLPDNVATSCPSVISKLILLSAPAGVIVCVRTVLLPARRLVEPFAEIVTLVAGTLTIISTILESVAPSCALTLINAP